MQRTHQWTKSPNPKSEEKVPVSSGRNSRSIPMYLLIFLDHNHLFRSNFTPHHLHLRDYCLLHTHTNSWLFFIQKRSKIEWGIRKFIERGIGKITILMALWCRREKFSHEKSLCLCLWRKEKRVLYEKSSLGNGQLL